MAFLITYPEQKVNSKLQDRLQSVGATIYCPMRLLRPVSVSNADKKLIADSEYLVITSPFSLSVYLTKFSQISPSATVIVLSQKMKSRLNEAGISKVRLPEQENQRSLVKLLRDLSDKKVIWLNGNLMLAHSLIPDSVKAVQIYENTWNKHLEQVAITKIRSHQINRILVTSPSSYQRIKVIQQQIPQCFSNVSYYVLGPSTGETIQRDGQRVVAPINAIDVLNQMLNRMVTDELSARVN